MVKVARGYFRDSLLGPVFRCGESQLWDPAAAGTMLGAGDEARVTTEGEDVGSAGAEGQDVGGAGAHQVHDQVHQLPALAQQGPIGALVHTHNHHQLMHLMAQQQMSMLSQMHPQQQQQLQMQMMALHAASSVSHHTAPFTGIYQGFSAGVQQGGSSGAEQGSSSSGQQLGVGSGFLGQQASTRAGEQHQQAASDAGVKLGGGGIPGSGVAAGRGKGKRAPESAAGRRFRQKNLGKLAPDPVTSPQMNLKQMPWSRP